MSTTLPPTGVAVIGLAGRFPGADDIDAFWSMLCAGRTGGRAFGDEELQGPPDASRDERYVRYGYPIEDIDRFDAAFFDITPREAALMDPQHRLFLECAWSAMEQAGYAPGGGTVTGVFAGCNFNTYLFNVARDATMARPADFVDLILGNDKDYLATRVSYKLDLRGPSLLVQSACSTALSAVAAAAQSLLSGQCDMAIAGASAIRAHQKTGYRAESDSGLSPDGKIRAFSDDAGGMVEGNGVAAVVLKRVAEAVADGDTIYAVIRGFAVNNDGASKAGFTAPSVLGQTAVIEEALAMAAVQPDSVGYVEAHGTGTPIGDPIEITALTRAYGGGRACIGLGSVKTNVGHLNTAAGLAGLIKAVLALHHEAIPPSLNYRAPNPRIDFAASPFAVVDRLTAWPRTDGPRRAAVSSFGLGGTNAHLILEEAPRPENRTAVAATQDGAPHLLTLSARSEAALDAAAARLAETLASASAPDLGDVAHTLNAGRKGFEYRACLVARDAAEAAAALRAPALARTRLSPIPSRGSLAFVFPGAGPQHTGMGADLLIHVPIYRETFARCAERFDARLGIRLRDCVADLRCGERLSQPREGLPALFATELALAETLRDWGIVPEALIGHSIGEYVAATLSGVFSLDAAIEIVAARATLIERTAPGGMLAVSLAEDDLAPMLGSKVSIAAVTAPGACIVSGAEEAVTALAEHLDERKIPFTRLAAARAGHSPLLDPILAEFRAVVARCTLSAPRLPMISNLTGTWLIGAEATDPGYWVEQLRRTVRFSDGIATLAAEPERLFLEVGPGRGLTALLKRHPALGRKRTVVASMRAADRSDDDRAVLLDALGRLWRAGMPLDLAAGYYRNLRPRRVPLPTYPFAGERHWIEHPPGASILETSADAGMGGSLFAPTWTRMPVGTRTRGARHRVVVVGEGLAAPLAERLLADGHAVERAPDAAGLSIILDQLRRAGEPADTVIFLDLSETPPGNGPGRILQAVRTCSYDPLVALCRSLALANAPDRCRLLIAARGLCRVKGDEPLDPWRAVLFGPGRVAASELPQIDTTLIDFASTAPADEVVAGLADAVIHSRSEAPDLVALRNGRRWRQDFLPLAAGETDVLVREGGSYLVIGGLGGIGLALARHLAGQARIRLTLVGRSAVEAGGTPPPAQEEACASLAALGAEVMVLAADAGDLGQMRRVIAEIETRFGALDGVVHAAGVAGGGLMQVGVPEGAASNLTAKVEGLKVLDMLLGGRGIDFLILTSSLGSFTGAVGQADNVAGNAVLDAYAQAGGPAGCRRCLSINWDVWLGVGMIVDLGERHERIAGEVLEGLTVAQACTAFDQAVATGEPQVAVSLKPLPALLANLRTRRGEALRRFEHAVSAPMAGVRPDLATAFLPPRHDLDWVLCAILADRLGMEAVGIDDDFVEAGGDSLLAMSVAAEIRDTLGVTFPVAALFQARCVRRIADDLAAQDGERLRPLAEALRQVKNMSPEAVQAALAATEPTFAERGA
ncbi:SDR family NAD(P)-dependent oxidoreductase [Methylorubrum zatmanii]